MKTSAPFPHLGWGGGGGEITCPLTTPRTDLYASHDQSEESTMANGAVQHNLPFSFTVSVSHTYRSRLHQIHQWQQCMVQSTQQPQTSLDSESFAHSSLFSQHSLTSLRGSYVQHCQLYYLHANDCSGVTVTYCHRERSAFRTFSTALIRS